MILLRPLSLVVLTTIALPAGAGRQGIDDPVLRTAVERFFATQETEDIDGYLSLWSTTVQRPRADQLKYVFATGDDKFSEVSIVRTAPAANRVRVLVRATRDRTTPPRTPDGAPFTFHSTTAWSLTYVKEGTDWKLVREGSAADGLAEALSEAASAAEREAMLTSEAEVVNDALIGALSRRAGEAAQARRYPEAQRGFELMRDVARRVGNQRLESEALQNLANAMYFQRDFTGALRVYEERLVLERARADDEGVEGALLGVATIKYSFAEYGAALTAYREALALATRRGDDGAIATTLISTGNVLYLQGDFAGAIADYTRSRDLSRKAENTEKEAVALQGMGRVLVAQGNYAAALEAFAGVLAEARTRGSRDDQGMVLLSIGDVHVRLGNLDSARAVFVESRTHFEALKDRGKVGRAWQAVALTDLAAGRVVLAEDEYRQSSTHCEAVGDRECVAVTTVGLAFAQTVQEKFSEGIASYKKGIAEFTAIRLREQAARAEVGLSHALSGDGLHASAVEAALHARSEGEALANDDVQWRARIAEATALRGLKESARAIAAAQAAVVAVDRLIETARVRPSLPVARDSSSVFALLALLQAEAGDAAAAFESAERMRVHDLRVVLAPGEREILRGMTDGEREDERRIAVELVSLHAQLTREKALPKPDADRIARLDASIADAAERRAAQQQALFARLPDLRLWRGSMAPATRDDVIALLRNAGSAIVQLVVTEDAVLVVGARRTEDGVAFTTQVEKVTRRALADKVSTAILPATLRDRAAWTKAIEALLPGLPAFFAGATQAIVVPHEVLWRVPFEALPVGDAYLAETTSVRYAPSVTSLIRTLAPPDRGEAPAGTGELFVGAIAPEIPPATVTRVAQTSPEWTLRPAASARQERDAVIAAIAPPAPREAGAHETVVLLDGPAATETALTERLKAADVIHLGAPFRINGASPLFSPVLLASDTASDGVLDAREVMNLDLHARVAVISDGGAMAMRDAADESATIAWAWRAAGVATIVLPRWRSDDQPSNDLLAALHARLRTGDPPAAALQTARQQLRARPDTAAPFFWASWMTIGR